MKIFDSVKNALGKLVNVFRKQAYTQPVYSPVKTKKVKKAWTPARYMSRSSAVMKQAIKDLKSMPWLAGIYAENLRHMRIKKLKQGTLMAGLSAPKV